MEMMISSRMAWSWLWVVVFVFILFHFFVAYTANRNKHVVVKTTHQNEKKSKVSNGIFKMNQKMKTHCGAANFRQIFAFFRWNLLFSVKKKSSCETNILNNKSFFGFLLFLLSVIRLVLKKKICSKCYSY